MNQFSQMYILMHVHTRARMHARTHSALHGTHKPTTLVGSGTLLFEHLMTSLVAVSSEIL